MVSLGEVFSSFEDSMERSKRFTLSLSFSRKFRFVQGGEISADGGVKSDDAAPQPEAVAVGVAAITEDHVDY